MSWFDQYFWWIIAAGAMIIVTLIGLLLFLRNQDQD